MSILHQKKHFYMIFHSMRIRIIKPDGDDAKENVIVLRLMNVDTSANTAHGDVEKS